MAKRSWPKVPTWAAAEKAAAKRVVAAEKRYAKAAKAAATRATTSGWYERIAEIQRQRQDSEQ